MLYRILIANPFINNVNRIIIAPVAAAFTWNAICGLEIQLNIWIGRTVKPASSHSKLRKGGSKPTGLGGKNTVTLEDGKAFGIKLKNNTSAHEVLHSILNEVVGDEAMIKMGDNLLSALETAYGNDLKTLTIKLARLEISMDL